MNRAIAALSSLLVNALLLRGALHDTPPPAPTDNFMQLVWIDATITAADETSMPEAPPPPSVRSLLAGLDMPHVDIDATDEAAMAVSFPSRARYVGEVTARIQRAWSVPSSVQERHCRLRINLDPAGEVRAITMNPCDADAQLQASISDAVRRAAPLPAPDTPESRGGELLLDFAVAAAHSDGLRSSVQPANASL